MPAVVPETSVLHSPAHSQAGRGRFSSGPSQAAAPFSELLGEPVPALEVETPSRPTHDRAQSERSPRDDKAPTTRNGAAPGKAAKSKPSDDAKQPEDDDVTAPTDAEISVEVVSVAKEPEADTDVDTASDSAIVVATSSDPTLAVQVPVLDTTAVAVAAEPVAVTVSASAPTFEQASASASASASESIAPAQTILGNILPEATPALIEQAAAPVPDEMPIAIAKPKAEVGAVQKTDDAEQTIAVFDEGAAKSKPATTDKIDEAIAQAPVSESAKAAHTPKGPKAADQGSETRTTNNAANNANTGDNLADLTVSGLDTNASRAAPEAPANPNPLPGPQASAPSAAPQSAQPSAGPAPAAVPIAGLAIEIAARAQAGKNRFEIRLDPPELGRIEVRLDVDRQGNVTSRLLVDRVETLDLLRRDAPNLERAFQQAGLKTSDNGLQFSLRDQAFSGRHDGEQAQAMARLVIPEDKPVSVEMQRNYGRLAGLGSGVDIRV